MLFTELPPCIVIIKDGQVVQVDEWVLWNSEPWMTRQIVRKKDLFVGYISNPEGGRTNRGSLSAILSGLHPQVQAQYVALFSLQNADEAAIQSIEGFKGHKVIIQN